MAQMNPTCVIHNAQARQLDRYVQSSKMLHAALLLLMLEALPTVTSFHHQPEAQHPISSAIHKNAGRLPHLLARGEATTQRDLLPLGEGVRSVAVTA